MGLLGGFLLLASFFGGTDEDVVSDGREEDEIAGADTEFAADFAGESEATAAEHCCGWDGFHGRFLD